MGIVYAIASSHSSIYIQLLAIAFISASGLLTETKTPRDHSDQLARFLQQPQTASSNLICPPSCEQMHCTPKKANKLKCRGGTTMGICNCCPECAKVENEDCGGDWNYLGKCDAGLYCEPRSFAAYASRALSGHDSVPTRAVPEGRCKKIPNEMMDTDGAGFLVRDNLAAGSKSFRQHPTCEPKCTPDFCERNPKAICSAIDVVNVRKDCHGKCQHTSCHACSWLEPDPDCGSCAADDFECLRRFARCVRKQHCSKDKFPCRARRAGDDLPQGKFQCEIPRCHGRYT